MIPKLLYSLQKYTTYCDRFAILAAFRYDLCMKKILTTILLLAVVVGGISFAVRRNTNVQTTDGKLRVVASFYPLYDFAKNVGGNKIDVSNVTPAGAEPHDFEPSAKVLAQAQKSDVFIYNGGQLEPWTAGFLHDFAGISVKSSAGISLQTTNDSGQKVLDPHFWLDPVLAQKIVNNIRDGLTKADPSDKSYFAKNAMVYNAQLAELDGEFRAGLAVCQTRQIITSHAAFGYLGKRYGLDVSSIAGITPDQEPSASKLAELAQLVKSKNIHYVFFESLVSPRLADTIAAETGAKTLAFDPLEGLSDADQKQGKNYISVQRQNLANLRTAGDCR